MVKEVKVKTGAYKYMNIFILDKNIKLCAQYHTNKHVVKMILEQTQILCTVLNDLNFETPYKSTHRNHPCTKWARESFENFCYLTELTIELINEYKYRYNKTHKCENIIFNKVINRAKDIKELLPEIGLTPFAQAMPEKYKNEDPIKAYRNYYNHEKRHLFRWTKYRKMPYWIE